MKLEASRTKDLSDISRMLRLAEARELERVRQIIQRYDPNSLDNLERLIQIGKLKVPYSRINYWTIFLLS
jgi:hypothetical protein